MVTITITMIYFVPCAFLSPNTSFLIRALGRLPPLRPSIIPTFPHSITPPPLPPFVPMFTVTTPLPYPLSVYSSPE